MTEQGTPGSFFQEPYKNFFRPLAGKYRDAVARCIRAFYLRLNGPDADYDYHQTRDDVIECFMAALRDAVVLDDEGIEGIAEPLNTRARAGAILAQLRDDGWIERYNDPGTMRTAFRMTGMGRQFAKALTHDTNEFATTTQNTRSTLAHLRTFLAGAQDGRPSVPDLMLATRMSADIVGDFNEIIEELNDQKRVFARSLTADAERARATGDDFFQYMRRRVLPDVHIRFNEDSVERYRAEIINHLDEIEALPDDTKRQIEIWIRQNYPTLMMEGRESVLIWVLDRIRGHIERACDAKLPELRRETQALMKRADSLVRHLTSLAFSEGGASVGQRVMALLDLSPEQVTRVLENPCSHINRFKVSLIDPGSVRPRHRRAAPPIDNALVEAPPLTREEHLELTIREELSRVFQVSGDAIRSVVVEALAGGESVRLSDLPVVNAQTLLAAVNVCHIAGEHQRESPFSVEPTEDWFENEYFKTLDFKIEYRPKRRASA